MSLSLIWSVLNILLVGFTFYYVSKKNKSVNETYNYLYKRVGTQCYKCNFDLSDDAQEFYDKLVKDKEDFKLCTQCNRDEKLYLLQNGKLKWFLFTFKSRFDKFLISDKYYKRFTLFMTISILASLIIHFVLLFTLNIKFFLWINYSIVTINFLVILYQNRLRNK